MSPYSYVPLTDNSLTCAHTGELCISVKKEHLLIHRSDHTCALAIYYQMDSLTKAMHCKDKHAINLKFLSHISRSRRPYFTIKSPRTISISLCTRKQAISVRMKHILPNHNKCYHVKTLQQQQVVFQHLLCV